MKISNYSVMQCTALLEIPIFSYVEFQFKNLDIPVFKKKKTYWEMRAALATFTQFDKTVLAF